MNLQHYPESMDYEITAPAAAQLLEASTPDITPKVRLIDVREPWEYATASIPGSTLIPMGEFAGRAHQELDPEDHLLVL